MLLQLMKQRHLNTWIPAAFVTWGESAAACEAIGEEHHVPEPAERNAPVNYYANGCGGIGGWCLEYGVRGGDRWSHPKWGPPLLGLIIEGGFDSCSVGKVI